MTNQPAQPPVPPGPYPTLRPAHPQGTTVLVLGILGLVFGICAPFAWYFGSRARNEIRASGVRYANEDQIAIGRVLGMIVTIVLIVGVVFLVVLAAIIAIVAATGSTQ
jgi:hypothetical protein